MPRLITSEELTQHRTRESLWVVCDKNVVIDVTHWIDKHPGGVAKILDTVSSQQFSFSTHFKHTRDEFDRVVERFLRRENGHDEELLSWTWTRSRSNGGLDLEGNPRPDSVGSDLGTIILIGIFMEK